MTPTDAQARDTLKALQLLGDRVYVVGECHQPSLTGLVAANHLVSDVSFSDRVLRFRSAGRPVSLTDIQHLTIDWCKGAITVMTTVQGALTIPVLTFVPRSSGHATVRPVDHLELSALNQELNKRFAGQVIASQELTESGLTVHFTSGDHYTLQWDSDGANVITRATINGQPAPW